MSDSRLTRIAPTPSGFLHLGNAVNFALTALLAQRWDAGIYLRIDDMDADRVRSEYIDDIFDMVEWIDIPKLAGASDRSDFEQNFTMARRKDYYRSQLGLLEDSGLDVFVCSCSRVELAASGSLRCVGQCRERGLRLAAGESALRVAIPDGTIVRMGDRDIDLAPTHGDVVLWRRDDHPAYHLVTVIEDRDLGVTDIVRGADLIDSSALHAWLAPHLGASNVAEANFVHHELLVDSTGHKLSKSTLGSGPLARTDRLRDEVSSIARRLASGLGY
jgi:glutamyl/glutaminyl-tRNA synthetase